MQRRAEPQQEAAACGLVELAGADVECEPEESGALLIGMTAHRLRPGPFDPPSRPGPVALHRSHGPMPRQVEQVLL
jgi:hypothetical protein